MSIADKPLLLPDKYADLQTFFDGFQREVLKAIEDAAPKKATFSTDNYTITNQSEDRTFDADSTSTDELADILATLIADLAGE